MSFRLQGIAVSFVGFLACGTRPSLGADDSDLIGGTDTGASDFPFALTLRPGCTAAKVGPRHVLTAAHCVVKIGSPGQVAESYLPGSTLEFTSDRSVNADREAPPGARTEFRKSTIEATHVHPSWIRGCESALFPACFGSSQLGRTESADVALIVLSANIEGIPSAAVDLDPLMEGDRVIVMGYGCESGVREDRAGLRRLRFLETQIAPTVAVAHETSPIGKSESDVLTLLEQGYSVTPGPAWRASEAGLCPGDSGGPLARKVDGTGTGIVVGVNHGYTFWMKDGVADPGIPVTNVHTRLNSRSRWQVGAWLEGLGVDTVRTCTRLPGGCVAVGFNGSLPQRAP